LLDGVELGPVPLQLLGLGPEVLLHRLALAVVAEIEGAVLAHHRIHRPHAGDVIAPARGPSRDGNDQKACLVQPFEGRIGGCRQHSLEVTVSSISVSTTRTARACSWDR
jgi:hypothetical protein